MDTSNDAPSQRSTILGSLLRSRPRNISHSPDHSPSSAPPSPSATTNFVAVAATALTGATAGLIPSNNPGPISISTSTSINRRQSYHPSSRSQTQNTTSSPTAASFTNSSSTNPGNIPLISSSSSPSIIIPPQPPQLPPLSSTTSSASAFANMLRRKPNTNSISNPTNPQQQQSQSSSSTPASTVPNSVNTPHIPVSGSSAISANINPSVITGGAHTTPASAPTMPFPQPPTSTTATSGPTSLTSPNPQNAPNNNNNININNTLNPTTTQPTTAATTTANPSNSGLPQHQNYRIRLVPHLDSRRSLRFEAITREVRDGDQALRIGRFTDRSGMGLSAVNALGSNKLAFKSKVVSRAHAEIWVERGGKFFIKDTKSSSGTFLNHMRLSPANQESRPHPLKDGDILQLGVDYQGGAEDIYKSVKIRIEVGREWQAGANAFNTNALRNLKNLAAIVGPAAASSGVKQQQQQQQQQHVPGAKPAKSQIPDCCICLFAVTIRQALFIAPCSHTFHYKCIRPLIEAHHPAFSCPLCRTYADLDEDVEVEASPELNIDDDADTDHAGGGGPGSGSATTDDHSGHHTHGHGHLDAATTEASSDHPAHGSAANLGGGGGGPDGQPIRPFHQDTDMSDGSIVPPVVPLNPFNSFYPFNTSPSQYPSHPHPSHPSHPSHLPQISPPASTSTTPIHALAASSTTSGTHTARLHTISEREADRDREAGGETEVEPDGLSLHLSLFGHRANRRAREREREREREGVYVLVGQPTGRGSDEMEGESERRATTECVQGGLVEAEEEGARSEVDEVEMVDAIEYDGPDEDSAMDEYHIGVAVAALTVPVDGAMAELGLGPGSGGAIGGATVSGGSIGGKRKR